MNWFLNLRTGTKLICSFGLLLAFLVSTIAVAYFCIEQITASLQTLYRRDFEAALHFVELRADMNRNRTIMLEMLETQNAAEQEQLKQDLKARAIEVDASMQLVTELFKDNPAMLSEIQSLKITLQEYRQGRETQLNLIAQGKVEEAKQLSVREQRERFDRLREVALALGQKAQGKARQSVADAEKRAHQSVITFVVIGAGALVVGVIMVLVLNGVIARPLTEISGVAERIAVGDLNAQVSAGQRKDEVGVLAQSFTRMTQSLQNMAAVAEQIAAGDVRVSIKPQSDKDALGIAFARMTQSLQGIASVAEQIAGGDVRVTVKPQSDKDVLGIAFARMAQSIQEMAGIAERIAAGDLAVKVKPQSDRDVLGAAFSTMTENLRGLMREVLEAVNVLAASASEIMASATQLAASAAETATAVAETTATVEEVKQTSQLSSEKAKYVSDQAQRVAEISQGGKRAVGQTIDGMTGIRQQMSAVAESILALSAQGQSIGEIIATVDDLAAQSKLLAVNAAIEAAKAGDEGKGFGVVAQEVRTLAEQSKQATTQVRGILNDIQKATSTAVLATEQASKAVEIGVQQSTTAGDSIGALAENVTDTAQAATQIAATSKEQFVGMDQVAMAMENIKTACTQTVASTRQAQTAAQQLHELGQKLKDLVGRFKT